MSTFDLEDDGTYSIRPRPKLRGGRLLLVVLFALLMGGRTLASFVIDYQWWKEVGQLDTWLTNLLYRTAPAILVGLGVFAVLWTCHALGVRAGGVRRRDYPAYSAVTTMVLLVLSVILSVLLFDSWTLVRFAGSRALAAGAWRDPVFGHTLSFYLFDLPFFRMLLGMMLAVVLAAAAAYWLPSRGWRLKERLEKMKQDEIDLRELRLEESLQLPFLRACGALFLVALAARQYLGRYGLLNEDHGFMVGIDYVAETISLPLVWFAVAGTLLAAVALVAGRAGLAAAAAGAGLIVPGVVPGVVNALFVRPNEISIQKPYIGRHLEATRAAFNLKDRVREVDFAAGMSGQVDATRDKALLDNVRLWDWGPFHDTVGQIQALRPYYVFSDTDIDRYRIGGKLQQVMLAPRELDVTQLPDARSRWINPHFIYTHGYGLVMADANRITTDGLPVMHIQNAPPEVKTPGLKVTRPEIYYGEKVHEPVFVRTGQQEFNYPSGSENVHTRYEGKGGFPIASLALRIAAAVREGDWNIVLTGYLDGESRMMIRRDVSDRVRSAAGFVEWDRDPYLILTEAGRLVWMIDGYTTSASHPYSRRVNGINYIRNSVKATVDAYDGDISLYAFDEADPLIQAYRVLFPQLFKPKSAMPAELLAHARYPERIFAIQAQVHRLFHMSDVEAFYNKEDVWDLARHVARQGGESEYFQPTYLMAKLPGEKEPEFLLAIPFTPRGKDNLISLMLARCDGEHLGEIVLLRVSKQELIFGPLQIKSRIDQDQTISKDLTLWNQQGSQVIRGQIQVLPIGNTFLYVEPIYIQAKQAPMPQLKKVAMALGSAISYADTYDQALAQLGAVRPAEAPPPAQAAAAGAPVPAVAASDPRLERVRQHLRRYRELMGQGKWADAGRELEALEAAASSAASR